VRAGTADVFRLLGRYSSLWMHWVETKTLPCRGNQCAWCAAKLPQRWQAYAPALLLGSVSELDTKEERNQRGETYQKTVTVQRPTWTPVVLEVTEGMAADLPPNDLRGRVIKASRAKLRKNAPVRVEQLGRAAEDDLVPSFDVKPIICRMWGERPALMRT